MIKFGSYAIGIAKIDDEVRENKFSILPKLLSANWSVGLTCLTCAVFIGGMKNQHDAILEAFATTEEIMISFTRLP